MCAQRKCLILFVLVAGALVGGWVAAALEAAERLLENAPPGSATRTLAGCVIAVIALLLFASLSLIYDFARAARRYAPDDRRLALDPLRTASSSVRPWLRALALFLFWLIVGAIAVCAGVGAAWTMPAVSWPAIALLPVVELAALGLRGRGARRDLGLLRRIPGAAPARRQALSTLRLPDVLGSGHRTRARRRMPSRIRSVFEREGEPHAASSPNASPGTAATCASERSLSQKPTDPFTDSLGIQRGDVGERIEGALGRPAPHAGKRLRASTMTPRRAS